jgi:hypothetical protein
MRFDGGIQSEALQKPQGVNRTACASYTDYDFQLLFRIQNRSHSV